MIVMTVASSKTMITAKARMIANYDCKLRSKLKRNDYNRDRPLVTGGSMTDEKFNLFGPWPSHDDPS